MLSRENGVLCKKEEKKKKKKYTVPFVTSFSRYFVPAKKPVVLFPVINKLVGNEIITVNDTTDSPSPLLSAEFRSGNYSPRLKHRSKRRNDKLFPGCG